MCVCVYAVPQPPLVHQTIGHLSYIIYIIIIMFEHVYEYMYVYLYGYEPTLVQGKRTIKKKNKIKLVAFSYGWTVE